jgi:hypothetical protein
MDSTLNAALSRLDAGEFLRIRDGIGQTLAVFDGLVWITQAGDPLDAFVAKGETFTLDRPGLAVVEALTDTRLAVLAAQAEHGAADERALA